MAIIESFSLSRSFKRIVAVDDLNLKVEAGEVLGFLGPNGAGKTTTIRMLAGIIAPTRGYALVDGLRTDRYVEQVHEVVGLLTETPGFYGRLSARRNLEFFGGFYQNINIRLQIDRYLKLMGLSERANDRAGTFSKGMKQRLALARALLHEPRVLFLDEPTAGLDPEAAAEVRGLIRKLSSEGRTIFLSTHNLAEAEMLCHRIAVIHTRLLALDTAERLRQRFFRRRVVIRLEALNQPILEAVKKLGFVRDLSEQDNQLVAELDEPEHNRPELVKSIVDAGGRVLEVSEKLYPLEEVYLKLMHENRDHAS